jgi:methionine-rich copper-binding protein CopC
MRHIVGGAHRAEFCYDAATPRYRLQGIGSMAWRALLGSTLAMLAATPALAHAIILESSPAVNATVAGPELDIVLRFNSRIDRARSSLTLNAPPAKPDAKPVALPLLGDSPDLLMAHAGGLAPGKYSLRWQVLSVDGHITRGDIPFTVAR